MAKPVESRCHTFLVLPISTLRHKGHIWYAFVSSVFITTVLYRIPRFSIPCYKRDEQLQVNAKIKECIT